MGIVLILIIVGGVVLYLSYRAANGSDNTRGGLTKPKQGYTIHNVTRLDSEGAFVFRYNGRILEMIPDPPYAIMAEDYRKVCLDHLEPFRGEIESHKGYIIINLIDYLNSVQLRMVDLSIDLEKRLASEVAKIQKPLPPVGTYDYVKREVKKAQARQKRKP